ncbi:MAG: beta-ketoacyl synthase N-terminal-like domain-containing protein [Pirellulaceae bacterium]
MTDLSRKRVAITGLGLVSPIGSDLDQVWDSLTHSKSGISAIESLPTASLPMQSGGQVKDFTGAIEDYGDLDKSQQRAIKKNMKVMCREIEMGSQRLRRLWPTAAWGPSEIQNVVVACLAATTF